MTQEELNQIRERVDKAIEGPWIPTGPDDRAVQPTFQWSYVETVLNGGMPICRMLGSDDDREFIAHARTDIPALLDEIERLRDRIAELDRGLDAAYKQGRADAEDDQRLF